MKNAFDEYKEDEKILMVEWYNFLKNTIIPGYMKINKPHEIPQNNICILGIVDRIIECECGKEIKFKYDKNSDLSTLMICECCHKSYSICHDIVRTT